MASFSRHFRWVQDIAITACLVMLIAYPVTMMLISLLPQRNGDREAIENVNGSEAKEFSKDQKLHTRLS